MVHSVYFSSGFLKSFPLNVCLMANKDKHFEKLKKNSLKFSDYQSAICPNSIISVRDHNLVFKILLKIEHFKNIYGNKVNHIFLNYIKINKFLLLN